MDFYFDWARWNWKTFICSNFVGAGSRTILADDVTKKMEKGPEKFTFLGALFSDSQSKTFRTLPVFLGFVLQLWKGWWCSHLCKGRLYSNSGQIQPVPSSFHFFRAAIQTQMHSMPFGRYGRRPKSCEVLNAFSDSELVGTPRHIDRGNVSTSFKGVKCFFYRKDRPIRLDCWLVQLTIVK